ELRDPRTGAGVVCEAYRREGLDQGPHLEDAPDVVFVTDPTYTTGHRVDAPFADVPAPGPHDWSGDHRMDGILCLTGRGVFKLGARFEANAVDVAPTLLHAADL